MKRRVWSVVAAVVLAGASPGLANGPLPPEQQAAQAIGAFASRLQTELKAALTSGGAAHAISVCQEKAPAIAEDLSAKYGGEVGRTSLRVRNPGNRPDTWETAVLEAFEQRFSAGEKLSELSFGETVQAEGQTVYRFMRAIPTKGVCLTCHGESIDPALAERIEELYPEDRARGFARGDIRGAFTVTLPMRQEGCPVE